MPRASLRLKHSGIRRTNIYGYGCQLRFRSAKSLAEDVAFTKAAIDSLKSEVVLVGHSYGGVVITEAGTHPKVTDLVYIAAFAPDKGESVSSLIANLPPGAPGDANAAFRQPSSRAPPALSELSKGIKRGSVTRKIAYFLLGEAPNIKKVRTSSPSEARAEKTGVTGQQQHNGGHDSVSAIPLRLTSKEFFGQIRTQKLRNPARICILLILSECS